MIMVSIIHKTKQNISNHAIAQVLVARFTGQLKD